MNRQDHLTYQTYMKDIERRYKVLTEKEEQKAVKDYQETGSRKAYNTLYNSQTKAVVKIARKYMNQGVPLLDLIQTGNVGLDNGIKRYQIGNEARLFTYASNWIKKEILCELASQSRFIKVNENEITKYSNVLKKINKAEQIKGRKLTEDEKIEASGIPEDKYKNFKMMEAETSLDKKVQLDDGEKNLHEILADKSVESPEDFELKNLSEKIIKALNSSRMTDRQRKILIMANGINCEPYEPHEIADQFGVSREMVRVDRRKAEQILRQYSDTQEANGEKSLAHIIH